MADSSRPAQPESEATSSTPAASSTQPQSTAVEDDSDPDFDDLDGIGPPGYNITLPNTV